MSFKDEEIIKLKKQLEQEKNKQESADSLEKEVESSIYDGSVQVVGKEVTFARRVIPELKVSIYMPEEFFRFTEELGKFLYPSGNTPSHIFGGEDINFQLTMSQTSHKVPDSGMKQFVDISARALEAMGPKVTIIEKRVEEKIIDNITIKEKTISENIIKQDTEKEKEKDVFHIGVLSFVSRAVDTMVYNVQFYISIDGQLLMGAIVFPSKFKKRMIPLAKEIINSIEVLKED